jgi:heavy metal sensor kinase
VKSIRLSLILYFLILLVVALGGILGFLYKTMLQTLEAKEESMQAMLLTENESRSRQLEDEFDNQVLRRAQTLASLAQSQWSHIPQGLYASGILTTPLTPHGHLLMPLWLMEGTERRLAFRFPRNPLIKIQYAEDVMLRDETGISQDYFQIFNDQGVPVQQSRSMGDRSFTLDPADRDLVLFGQRFDDTELKSGVPLRRVTLRVPVSSLRVPLGPFLGWRPGGERTRPRNSRTGGEFADRAVPAFFFQYACDTTLRDQALASYRNDLAYNINNLKTESADTFASLREMVGWIGLGIFAGSLLGGCWLVGLGLSPLNRLSEAVSRVSVKDFRLQFDASHLPRELRPILERLNETLELLRRAFAREKQAAADISHELRTPLAALLTTIEVGLRRPRTPEHYTELLQDCRAIGQQMTQLVERLLALARIDAGVDLVRTQPVDVAALARQCVSLVRPLAEARELSLGLHCEGSTSLTTDPDKLREVITNLLHNAIEYNRPRGSIDVTVGRNNGHLHVDVRDTGIGISAKALGHVFERFYRADESRQADGLHAGVGLSIVKGYVDLMGGSVTVHSTEGVGSTFRVELPVR